MRARTVRYRDTRLVAPDACNVTVDGVTQEFPGRRGMSLRALEDVSFTIGAGELVALLGPSGCGKSTLLRMLGGLIAPSAGDVLVAGMEPHELSRLHRIGIAFQDHGLLPWLSTRANVALPFHLAGQSPDKARVDSLLRLVGLDAFAEARPAQLSGGMRQRASIARALVCSDRRCCCWTNPWVPSTRSRAGA
jgi:NitT/TauT family transport system ATP-binding protein